MDLGWLWPSTAVNDLDGEKELRETRGVRRKRGQKRWKQSSDGEKENEMVNSDHIKDDQWIKLKDPMMMMMTVLSGTWVRKMEWWGGWKRYWQDNCVVIGCLYRANSAHLCLFTVFRDRQVSGGHFFLVLLFFFLSCGGCCCCSCCWTSCSSLMAAVLFGSISRSLFRSRMQLFTSWRKKMQ